MIIIIIMVEGVREMRLKAWTIIALLLAVTAISACGGNGTARSDGTESSASAGGTKEPNERTVSTVNGEVTIPAEPRRIVATYYIGELAALGMKPVGTVKRLLGEANPNLADYTEGVTDIGASPNLEAIAALDPDMIIATDFDEIPYEDYAKIAPTVVIPWSDDDVWAKLRTIAKLLGKEAEAEDYIQTYEAKAAKARETIKEHVEPGETVSILMFNGKKIGVFGARDVGFALYDSLRLSPPAKVKEMMKDPAFSSDWTISLENIPELAGDRIFVAVYNEDGDKGYQELQKLSIWSGLSAVKNHKVYEIPSDKWFTYDPISVSVTLDSAVRILTADDSR